MKVGFIGTGNMGSAIIRGLYSSKFLNSEDINVYDINAKSIQKILNEYNVVVEENEKELVKKSNVIILCVKPHIIPEVLVKIRDIITDEHIVLSIAAGVSLKNMEDILGKDKKIVRTMPNTPAQILEGMTAVSFNKNIEENEKNIIFNILNSFGKSIEIEEEKMSVFTAISGSLPAYIYLFIEGIADGAVLEGMDRKKAYEIIAQSVIGSGKMILETKKHPGELKDEVTSPGGTTIEALRVLENSNFRGTLINTVKACTEKSEKMNK